LLGGGAIRLGVGEAGVPEASVSVRVGVSVSEPGVSVIGAGVSLGASVSVAVASPGVAEGVPASGVVVHSGGKVGNAEVGVRLGVGMEVMMKASVGGGKGLRRL